MAPKTLERIRKEFDAKSSEIEKEYDKKIKELETKIFYKKKERSARLVRAERQFRRDSRVFVEFVIGEKDYNWFNEWLMKNKEMEIREAEKKHETKLADKLNKMSSEDYLFHFFNKPEIQVRLRREMEQSRSEEAKRLSLILAKLNVEYLRLSRTRV